MFNWTRSMLLIFVFILSGCFSSASYKEEDVAAIVRGEEITTNSLRFLYPDDDIANMIEGVIQAKLAQQEVKKMNIDITKQIQELAESYGKYPDEKERHETAQSIRAFADPQAEKLGIDPKEYYETYTERSTKMVAYVNAYVSEVLGELGTDEFGIEEYQHHANELLDNLMEQNKGKIEILIK